jgi:hypothetical protein
LAFTTRIWINLGAKNWLIWFRKKILENQKNGLPLPNFRQKIGVNEELLIMNYELVITK